MNPFTKLSARQWGILERMILWEAILQKPYHSGASRSRGGSESERVASLRAYASLVKRGLIVRGEWQRYTLAVPPRTVLNAAMDRDPAAVKVSRLGRAVETIERNTWKADRRERMKEWRRVRPEAFDSRKETLAEWITRKGLGPPRPGP